MQSTENKKHCVLQSAQLELGGLKASPGSQSSWRTSKFQFKTHCKCAISLLNPNENTFPYKILF